MITYYTKEGRFNIDNYKNIPYDKLHNPTGPALILSDGSKQWWINGQLHRKKFPAVIWKNGDVEYFNLGNLHREDGPAIIWGDEKYENVEFWIYGEMYSKKEFMWIKENNIDLKTKKGKTIIKLKFR